MLEHGAGLAAVEIFDRVNSGTPAGLPEADATLPKATGGRVIVRRMGRALAVAALAAVALGLPVGNTAHGQASSGAAPTAIKPPIVSSPAASPRPAAAAAPAAPRADSAAAARPAAKPNPAPAAAALPTLRPPAPARIGFDPTTRYVQKNLCGWQVMFHERLFKDQQELGARVNGLLWQQLHQIDFKLPAKAVSRLRLVKIWVEVNEPHFPCMVYHPNTEWLYQHGMNPDKTRAVEISNSTTFLSWSVMQPWVVLHELSHAYHDQVLGGFDNPDVKRAYDDAVASKLYERVLFANGRPQRHYGLTNPQEFFAEQSEAFFGVNDYYPFVRAELAHYDRRTYEMLRQMWWKE